MKLQVYLQKKKAIQIEKNSTHYFITNLNILQSSAFEFLYLVWQRTKELTGTIMKKKMGNKLPTSLSEFSIDSYDTPTSRSLTSEKIPDISDIQMYSDVAESENPKSILDEFISGCESIKFKKDAVVASEMDINLRRLYYVNSGKCRLNFYRVNSDKEKTVSRTVKEGALFGHIDFLLGTSKVRYLESVIAFTDVTVTLIEPYFLNVLFQHHPEFAGNFFMQLGQVLYSNLKEK